MPTSLILYLATIATLGLLVLARSWVLLTRSERTRRSRVEARELMDAIATSSPFDDPNARAKQHAYEAIDEQSTAVKRLIAPLVILITTTLLILPFLSEASATTVSLVAAALTVVLGVTTRNIIENAIAGLLISASRTFNIADTVTIEGQYGTVEDIGITHSTVKIWDWRRLVIPNARLLGSDFVNHSLHDRFQWTKVQFWVAYHGDLGAIRAMARSAMEASEHYQPYEPARCWVMALEREAIELWVVGWADTPSEAWALACDVRCRIHEQLTAMGVVPHRHHLALSNV